MGLADLKSRRARGASTWRAALGRLTRRAEFLRVARGKRRWAAPGLVLQVRLQGRPIGEPDSQSAWRVGFTVTKKVGNAVIRNRVKRRLRAAVLDVLPLYAAAGHDYVVIGRQGTLARDYEDLKGDLELALERTGVLVQRRGECA